MACLPNSGAVVTFVLKVLGNEQHLAIFHSTVFTNNAVWQFRTQTIKIKKAVKEPFVVTKQKR